jgi:TPR repeat protein
MDKLLIRLGGLIWELDAPPRGKIVVGNREGMDLLIGESSPDGREFFSLQRQDETWGFQLIVPDDEAVLMGSNRIKEGIFYLPLRLELSEYGLSLEFLRKEVPTPLEADKGLPALPVLSEREYAAGLKLHPTPKEDIKKPPFGKSAISSEPELPPLPESQKAAMERASPSKSAKLWWVYPALAIILILAAAIAFLLLRKVGDNDGPKESAAVVDQQSKGPDDPHPPPSANESRPKETILEELLSEARRLEEVGRPAEALEKYKAAFREGSAEGANAAGVLIMQGEGIAAEAFEFFEEAARKNHARANYNAGLCLKDGLGVSADEGRAFDYFQRAAELGNPEGMNALAMAFLQGDGVARDPAKALEWFERAADNGVPSAMDNLGTMYARAQGVPKNINKAREWYRKAIDAGDATARENLEILENLEQDNIEPNQTSGQAQQNSEENRPSSDGTTEEGESNQVMSLNAALEKANNGDNLAQAILSFYYGLGYKVEKNIEISADYAMKSASQGHPLGIYRLGSMRQVGEGMEKNEAQGRALKAKAFDGLNSMSGDPYAMTALGVMLFRGEGVAKNRSEAARLYRLAADMGYAPAQFNFSACLMSGQGVQKNEPAALSYWRAAYEQAYPPAMSGPPK